LQLIGGRAHLVVELASDLPGGEDADDRRKRRQDHERQRR
jgi:hypothetical protein